MKRWMILSIAACVLTVISLTPGSGPAADTPEEAAVKYILATVRAFRTVYVEQVLEHVQKAGVQPREDWSKDSHASMLPFQFVKMAGLQMNRENKDVEVGIISLTPIYTANFPKTQAEVEALKKLMADPKQKVVTFSEGKEFKGLAPDIAIEQSCADCHNHHPNSHKRDFKKGDLMGAIVVRLTRRESP